MALNLPIVMEKKMKLSLKDKVDGLYDETRSEPDITFFDNIISQMDVDTIDLYSMNNEEITELCESILKELCNSDENMRKYFNSDILYPTIHTYTYDSYPDPFHAPTNGCVVSCCFAKGWSKNWGGEYITFHDTEPEDIISSFPGRVYVSVGTPWCKITQPNIRAKRDLVYLQFRIK